MLLHGTGDRGLKMLGPLLPHHCSVFCVKQLLIRWFVRHCVEEQLGVGRESAELLSQALLCSQETILTWRVRGLPSGRESCTIRPPSCLSCGCISMTRTTRWPPQEWQCQISRRALSATVAASGPMGIKSCGTSPCSRYAWVTAPVQECKCSSCLLGP